MCLIPGPVQGLNSADLGCTVTGGLRSFSDAQFLDLPVVNYLLMPFLVCLLAPVFTQRMRQLYSLLLSLATAQSVLMRHCCHQVDKHIVDGGYHSAGDRISLRRVFISQYLP